MKSDRNTHLIDYSEMKQLVLDTYIRKVPKCNEKVRKDEQVILYAVVNKDE